MANLQRSTVAADSMVESCMCVTDCLQQCKLSGTWHNHVDEVCALHPDTIVD